MGPPERGGYDTRRWACCRRRSSPRTWRGSASRSSSSSRTPTSIHVDIMDGHFVPPIALGTVVVAVAPPGDDDRTLHGHLMVDAPASLVRRSQGRRASTSCRSTSRRCPTPNPPSRRRGEPAWASVSRSTSRRRSLPPSRTWRDRRPHADEHPAGLVVPGVEPRGLSHGSEAARAAIDGRGLDVDARDRRRGQDRERTARRRRGRDRARSRRPASSRSPTRPRPPLPSRPSRGEREG